MLLTLLRASERHLPPDERRGLFLGQDAADRAGWSETEARALFVESRPKPPPRRDRVPVCLVRGLLLADAVLVLLLAALLVWNGVRP